MTFEEYEARARSTAIYPAQCNLLYPILGLASEAGELAGKYKKVLRDRDGEMTNEVREALLDELGDTLWYVAAVARDLGTSLGLVAGRNLDKLADRSRRGVIGGSGDSR